MSDYTEYSTDSADRLYPLRLFPIRGWISMEEFRALFTEEEIKAKRKQMLGLSPTQSHDVYAEPAGEKRPPRKGEWYLSGAIVEAWRAPSDLDDDYRIARLVRIKRREIVNVAARMKGVTRGQEEDHRGPAGLPGCPGGVLRKGTVVLSWIDERCRA